MKFVGNGTLQVSSADGTLDGVTLGVDTTLLRRRKSRCYNDLVLDDVTSTWSGTIASAEHTIGVALNFSGGEQKLDGTGVVELVSTSATATETTAESGCVPPTEVI